MYLSAVIHFRLQFADPVLDKLDIHQAVSHRLFRESCYNHNGDYVKVTGTSFLYISLLTYSI
jgi:TFIIF-interacting CTD phosphatase-like protein